MSTLTFDEFHAVRKRERNNKAQEEENSEVDNINDNESIFSATSKISSSIDSSSVHMAKTNNDTDNTTIKPEENVGADSWFTWMGNFIELQEFQLMMIGLIFLDIIATTFSIVLQAKMVSEVVPEATALMRGSVLSILKSFMDFTLFFFSFEMGVLIVSFRSGVLFHFGYLTDIVVLSSSILQLFTDVIPLEYRLISLLRLWRVVRLVNSMLLVGDKKVQEVMNLLKCEQVKSKETKKEIEKKDIIIRRDLESKKRLENMLQGYKDEIETLNEALKIAALDVAMVAEDDSEDEDMVEENTQNTIFVNEDGTYSVKST